MIHNNTFNPQSKSLLSLSPVKPIPPLQREINEEIHHMAVPWTQPQSTLHTQIMELGDKITELKKQGSDIKNVEKQARSMISQYEQQYLMNKDYLLDMSTKFNTELINYDKNTRIIWEDLVDARQDVTTDFNYKNLNTLDLEYRRMLNYQKLLEAEKNFKPITQTSLAFLNQLKQQLGEGNDFFLTEMDELIETYKNYRNEKNNRDDDTAQFADSTIVVDGDSGVLVEEDDVDNKDDATQEDDFDYSTSSENENEINDEEDRKDQILQKNDIDEKLQLLQQNIEYLPTNMTFQKIKSKLKTKFQQLLQDTENKTAYNNLQKSVDNAMNLVQIYNDLERKILQLESANFRSLYEPHQQIIEDWTLIHDGKFGNLNLALSNLDQDITRFNKLNTGQYDPYTSTASPTGTGVPTASTYDGITVNSFVKFANKQKEIQNQKNKKKISKVDLTPIDLESTRSYHSSKSKSKSKSKTPRQPAQPFDTTFEPFGSSNVQFGTQQPSTNVGFSTGFAEQPTPNVGFSTGFAEYSGAGGFAGALQEQTNDNRNPWTGNDNNVGFSTGFAGYSGSGGFGGFSNNVTPTGRGFNTVNWVDNNNNNNNNNNLDLSGVQNTWSQGLNPSAATSFGQMLEITTNKRAPQSKSKGKSKGKSKSKKGVNNTS